MRRNAVPRQSLCPIVCRSAAVAGLLGLTALAIPHSARSADTAPNAPPNSASAPSRGMAGSTIAGAVNATPRIVFAGTPLPFSSPQRAPYRDSADGVLCVAPQSLAPLGITYIVDQKASRATFAGPGGDATVTVDLRATHDDLDRTGWFVSANDVIEGLGGKCEWYPETNTLQARAVLTSIQMLGGQLQIKATLPILPSIVVENDGREIIIDIQSAERGTLPHALDLQSPLVDSARVGQFQDDVTRIVLQMKQPYAFSLQGGKPSPQIVLNPTLPAALPTALPATTSLPPPSAATAAVVPASALANAVTVTNAAPTAAAATAVKSSAKPAAAVNRAVSAAPRRRTGKAAAGLPSPPPVCIVNGVTFHRVSDEAAQLFIRANRVPAIRAALTKGSLTLNLLNTSLAAKAGNLSGFDHPLLKAVKLIANGTSAGTQLVLSLTRAVVYTIRPSDRGPIELDLTVAHGDPGQLAGKTIVVDPGHGAHDSGAPGVNGTLEKNVNLAIAIRLTEALRDAGANVIMTRSSDYFIPVDERPIIANRAGADFFISVHADSSDYNHSVVGSTVYYHFDQPLCKLLARYIAQRLGDVGSVPSRGIGSDGLRFPGVGYGVLRGSQMAAVLVECGYMSNGGDVRQLNNPDVQQKTAEAIVRGLRDFIAANPKLDTRLINPQKDDGTFAVPTAPAVPDTNATPPPDDAPLVDSNGEPIAAPADTTNAAPKTAPNADPQDDTSK